MARTKASKSTTPPVKSKAKKGASGKPSKKAVKGKSKPKGKSSSASKKPPVPQKESLLLILGGEDVGDGSFSQVWTGSFFDSVCADIEGDELPFTVVDLATDLKISPSDAPQVFLITRGSGGCGSLGTDTGPCFCDCLVFLREMDANHWCEKNPDAEGNVEIHTIVTIT